MSEQAVASGMAGASMSGASPIDAGLTKAQTGLGKIVSQLKQVETLLTSIGKKSGSMSVGNSSSGAGGGSVMSTSLGSFSTASSGGGNTIASGMSQFSAGPVFGGIAAAGMYAAGAAYGMLPQTGQAVDRMTTLHIGAMGVGSSSYNPMGLNAVARASFGNNVSGINSDVQAAAALSRTGMNPMSMGGQSIMRAAGVAYQTLGMDNVTATSALNNFYGGAQGSAMFQFGIRSRDNNGKPVSMTSLVNQIYGINFAGIKNVSRDSIGTAYQSGFLKKSMESMGITDENQQQILLQGLMSKSDSVRTGKKFSMDTVPGAAQNGATNPLLSQGASNAAQNNGISASMPGLVDGFNKANGLLATMNNSMAQMVTDGGSAAQSLLSIKGSMDTLAASRQGGDLMTGAGGVAKSIGGAYMAGKALNVVKAIAGGAAPEVAGAGAGAGSTVASAAGPIGLVAAGAYAASQTQGYQNMSAGDRVTAVAQPGSAAAYGAGLSNLAATWQGFKQGGFSGAWDALFGGGGIGGTPSHASGAWQLPRDQIAHIHKDEMILPASVAAAVRNSIGKTGAGASAGPTHVTIKVMLQNGSDAEVLKAGKQIKSIIENPALAQNMKES